MCSAFDDDPVVEVGYVLLLCLFLFEPFPGYEDDWQIWQSKKVCCCG